MKKLDKTQVDFLLEYFFKDESFVGWRNIGERLIENGSCIIAGIGCPWKGRIGNFIERIEARLDRKNVEIEQLREELRGREPFSRI